MFFEGLKWPKMGPRGLQKVSCAIYPLRGGPFGVHLGPPWAILGPPWPFLGGPGGHLEADLGLGRLALGVQGGQKLRCKKQHFAFRLGEMMVFGCFWEARGLQKACKVAVWRSCCGSDASKRATCMLCWLQAWITKGSWNFRSTKLASGS